MWRSLLEDILLLLLWWSAISILCHKIRWGEAWHGDHHHFPQSFPVCLANTADWLCDCDCVSMLVLTTLSLFWKIFIKISYFVSLYICRIWMWGSMSICMWGSMSICMWGSMSICMWGSMSISMWGSMSIVSTICCLQFPSEPARLGDYPYQCCGPSHNTVQTTDTSHHICFILHMARGRGALQLQGTRCDSNFLRRIHDNFIYEWTWKIFV